MLHESGRLFASLLARIAKYELLIAKARPFLEYHAGRNICSAYRSRGT
jgi:hypothetical protein